MMSESESEEWRQDRKEALRELLDTVTWRGIVVPNLRRRMAALARTLALSQRDDLEAIRLAQGRYHMLVQLLNHPDELLGDDLEGEDFGD